MVLLGSLWLVLSTVEGSWSLSWVGMPAALTGLAAAVSVFSPGWRRLMMGIVGVCGLVWLGFVARPWLLQLIGGRGILSGGLVLESLAGRRSGRVDDADGLCVVQAGACELDVTCRGAGGGLVGHLPAAAVGDGSGAGVWIERTHEGD